MIWIGVILLGIGAVLWLLRALLIRGQYRVLESYVLDGEEVRVVLHFGSRYPKLLGHQGSYAGKGHLCFRAYPQGYPVQVIGVPWVTSLLVAHELAHDIDRRRRGFWGFWSRAWWMMLTKSYKDRAFEQEAIAAAPLLLAGSYPGVEAHDMLYREV
jgi:hypothetical protein